MTAAVDSEACSVPGPDLVEFARGTLAGPPRRTILEHLLRGCPECRRALEAMSDMPQPPPPEEDGERGEMITQLLRGLDERAARIEAERRRAAELLAGFLPHPAERQWTMVRNTSRYRTWSFVDHLTEAVFESVLDVPRRSLELARIAVHLAAAVDPRVYGERLVLDLRARAVAHRGNVERVLGDLPAARRSLTEARSLAGDGSLDPLLEAEIDYLEASWFRAQRDFPRALKRIRAARTTYSELGENRWLCLCLTSEGVIRQLSGDGSDGIDEHVRAVEVSDLERWPRSALAARHNLVWATMAAERPRQALELLDRFLPDYEAVGDRTSRLRLTWLEARIHEQLGDLERAGARYEEAVEGFSELELPYEVATVALDHALLLSRASRPAEVARLAAETLEIFRSLGVEREALAAWLLFVRSARAGAVGSALIEQLAAYFRRARFEPGLAFSG